MKFEQQRQFLTILGHIYFHYEKNPQIRLQTVDSDMYIKSDFWEIGLKDIITVIRLVKIRLAPMTGMVRTCFIRHIIYSLKDASQLSKFSSQEQLFYYLNCINYLWYKTKHCKLKTFKEHNRGAPEPGSWN